MGVCQDQVQVMVVCCWVLGVLVCYVSGYFYVVGEEDFVSYVWVDVCFDVELYIWCSIDVIYQCFIDVCYIWLVVGCDYQLVVLVCGVWQGGGVEMLDVSIFIELLFVEVV